MTKSSISPPLSWAIEKLKNMRTRWREQQRQTWQKYIIRQFSSCGRGTHLNRGSVFVFPERISLGDNVHIGSNGWFQGYGSISIGDNVHISRNCAVFSSNHNYHGERLPYDSTYVAKPVSIERNVWLGMNVMIIPGVTISEGAIVGLGTVVTKDVPAMAIVGGYGHRILGYRDQEHYERLNDVGLYGGRGGAPLHE